MENNKKNFSYFSPEKSEQESDENVWDRHTQQQQQHQFKSFV